MEGKWRLKVPCLPAPVPTEDGAGRRFVYRHRVTVKEFEDEYRNPCLPQAGNDDTGIFTVTFRLKTYFF
jgi:hypothetical protein